MLNQAYCLLRLKTERNGYFMYNIIYNSIFLAVCLYFTIKAIAYALYEINNEKNKSGGITIITFSSLIFVFVNIVIWTR